MKVFFGLLFTTLVNFTCGLAGFYIASTFLVSFVPKQQNTITTYDFLSSFLLKFAVILMRFRQVARLQLLRRRPVTRAPLRTAPSLKRQCCSVGSVVRVSQRSPALLRTPWLRCKPSMSRSWLDVTLCRPK